MYIPEKEGKSRPVLHIIDAETRFNEASFLSKNRYNYYNLQSGILFIKRWSAIYIGFLECIMTDQGSVFISKEWKSNCDLEKIELIHRATESHNSLGLCEKHHSNLRMVYQKLRCDHPDVHCDIAVLK